MTTESFDLSRLSGNLQESVRLLNKKRFEQTGNFVSIKTSVGNNGNVEECHDGSLMSISRRDAFDKAQKYATGSYWCYDGLFWN